MKVLVLGMPRTGTQSMAEALIQLGISPVYHMREVGKNNHHGLWLEAMESKFEGKGKPLGRERFEEIMGGYEGTGVQGVLAQAKEQALADYPAAIFPTELMAAYPEAAVILTVRSDEQKWHDSMMLTLIHAHLRREVRSPMADKYHEKCWNNDFPKDGIAAYRAQNAVVREAAKERRFLEYEVGSGWAPLCEFLGLPQPHAPYPRADDWAEYKREVVAAMEEERKTAGVPGIAHSADVAAP